MDDGTGHLCPLEEVLAQNNPVDFPQPGGGEVDEDPGVQDGGEELGLGDGGEPVALPLVVVSLPPQLHVEVDHPVGREVNTVSVHDPTLGLVLHLRGLRGEI